MSRCLAWKIHDSTRENFDNGGPKFYLPIRCSKLCVGTENVCQEHYEKRQKPTSKKNHPSSYWGLVSEPIRNFGDATSILAFGPWFMEKAKQYPLSESKMRKLKAQYAAATEGVPNAPPVPEVNAATPSEVSTPSPAAAKPRGRKKKEVIVAPTPPVVAPTPPVVAAPAPAPAAPAPAAAEPKKKRQVKKAQVEVVQPVPVSGIVMDTKPVEVEDFVEVPVRPFEHSGTLYYLDPKKQKLYDRNRDGSTKGIYKGRWDSIAESIVTGIPDSDEED